MYADDPKKRISTIAKTQMKLHKVHQYISALRIGLVVQEDLTFNAKA